MFIVTKKTTKILNIFKEDGWVNYGGEGGGIRQEEETLSRVVRRESDDRETCSIRIGRQFGTFDEAHKLKSISRHHMDRHSFQLLVWQCIAAVELFAHNHTRVCM